MSAQHTEQKMSANDSLKAMEQGSKVCKVCSSSLSCGIFNNTEIVLIAVAVTVLAYPK